MPVTADRPAPYAPASAILALVTRHRTRGLPSYDADVLARAGVSSSLIPRTLQALRTLDLIDDDGRPTPILEGLRLAPEAEFKARMAEWLTEAYADALSYVDPSKDDEVNIRDAFRGYQPVGQQSRMVTLFTGLFAAAGIAPEKSNVTSRKPSRSPASKPTVQKPRKGPENSGVRTSKGDQTPLASVLPPALAGLLASLPRDGNSWAKRDRDRFLLTFEAVLDFCYPTTRDKPQRGSGEPQVADEASADPL